MSFVKNFVEWFNLKPKLEIKTKRLQFSVRDVWMIHLGCNLGFEIDGKNKEYLRPAIVFRKLSKQTLLVIPLTSTLKNGNWYSKSYVKNQEGRFCLNQVRMIDSSRLKYKLERVPEKEFEKLTQDFINFIKA